MRRGGGGGGRRGRLRSTMRSRRMRVVRRRMGAEKEDGADDG